MSSFIQTIQFWGTSLILLFPFLASSANIAIIESQSFHPMQIMDANWQTAASNMGHTATILPQSTLDNISSFDNIDVLIISSGLIDLPANRQATIKAFFESGRSLYLQSEFQLTHPGNVLFEEMIEEQGDSFTWEGESQGSITPMSIIGDLNNTPNSINQLTYYWYGTYGTGDSSVIPFLENNNKDYGFIYCPPDPALGKIITTTDQDWIRIFLSEILMQNIIYTLSNTTVMTVAPLVSTTLTDVPDCENGTYTFESDIQNTMNGINYQWQINGTPVANATGSIFSSNELNEGDVVECVIFMDMECATYTHVSNPILIAPIIPLEEISINISSDQSDICTGTTVQFISEIVAENNPTTVSYQWQINNQDVVGEIASTFSTSLLENDDVVSCNMDYVDLCGSTVYIISNDITTTVQTTVLPSIEITSNNSSVCEGENITFTAEGSYWGSQPILQWQIDGMDAGTDSSIFTTNELTSGQAVTCVLISNEACVSNNEVTSSPVEIIITESLVPTITLLADQSNICQGETVTFNVSGDNWGNNPFFTWTVNGQTIGDNEPVFSSNNLTDNAQVLCTVNLDGNCLTTNELNAQADPITVQTPVTPLISISSDLSQACAGVMVTFTADIQNGGENPVYQWIINNNPVGEDSPVFATNNLEDGQIISCQLISDLSCTTLSSVVSNEIGMQISDMALVINQQNDDYCGQGNGKIQVGVNNAIAPLSYLWSNGLTSTTITDLSAGNYTVTVTDALGCSTTLSTNIAEVAGLEIEELIIEMTDCSGTNGAAIVQMKDPNRNYHYTWMNDKGEVVSLNEIANDLVAGKYMLEVSDDSDCFLTEELIVEGSNSVSLEMDDRLFTNWGVRTQLEPSVAGSGELNYEWFPSEGLSCSDCPNPTFTADKQIEYTLTVSNENGCSAEQKVLVVVRADHEIFIPNAFSPNGDGNNDFFMVYAGNNVNRIKSLQVADRWGNVLFSKQDFEAGNDGAGWDGSYKGKRAGVGVYLFVMEVEFTDGHVQSFGGDITLAR